MSRVSAISEYWESLKSALADYELSNEEISYLKFKKEDLQIDDESMRWLHARAFSGILANFSDDHRVDHVESELLHSISKGLREIGWSPGDPVTKEEASGRRRGLLGWLQP